MGGQKQYRVLVAEDDDVYVDVLEGLLERDGRFVVAARARNGQEAIDLARRLDVDAVVMDIEMPVVDGVEATLSLQESAPGLPVVAISGHDYEERVLEMRHAGAVDYVRKSRVEEELADALVALLEARLPFS